jgi:hypothetical protein
MEDLLAIRREQNGVYSSAVSEYASDKKILANN